MVGCAKRTFPTKSILTDKYQKECQFGKFGSQEASLFTKLLKLFKDCKKSQGINLSRGCTTIIRTGQKSHY